MFSFIIKTMDDNLFAEFIFQFLSASPENIEKFYLSFLPNKTKWKFDFHEAIPFGARILSILLKHDNTSEKELLLEHLRALYNNYASLYLVSKRTVEDGENDYAPSNYGRAFDNNGSLNMNEFNNIVEYLINYYITDSFYYELLPDKIIVKFPRKNITERYREKVFEIQEGKASLFLVSEKVKVRLWKINRDKKGEEHKYKYDMLKAKGYQRAEKISLAIKNCISKMNDNEACCWCNPIEKTKHKCLNCVKLHKKYEELIKQGYNVPKNLNQIIKRIHETNKESSIEEIKKKIKDKITKNVNCYCKNNSSVKTAFLIYLADWFKKI